MASHPETYSDTLKTLIAKRTEKEKSQKPKMASAMMNGSEPPYIPKGVHPPHPWVNFPAHIAQNVDSLKSAIHTRDSLQDAQDRAIDEKAGVKAPSKAKQLKDYLRKK
jgi:hypothetical protein